MLKSTFNGLQRCRSQYRSIYIHLFSFASQICEIPRNSPKIRTHSSSRSCKVNDLGADRKRTCDFLLVINSNFDRMSCRFRDIDEFCLKIACFFPTLPCLTPPYRRNALRYQVIRWKVHLMVHNSVSENVGLSSFLLLLLTPKIAKSGKIPTKFDLSSSRSSKVIDLGVNRKLHMRLPISD